MGLLDSVMSSELGKAAVGIAGDALKKGVSVKVLGNGGSACSALLENAQKAISSLKLGIDVEYITDAKKTAGYGADKLPALVVNEKVVSAGEILKPDEIIKLVSKIF